MMEIGSFIELQFNKGLEWYSDTKYAKWEIARLNSGRAAIYHAVRCLGCDTVYLPYYQCETVRTFLTSKNVKIKYYYIDEQMRPLTKLPQQENEAVVLVNYYGVMSKTRMETLAKEYKNVVIDNAQAFFSEPIEDCLNVYSARKFIGTPDGAYVIGKGATRYMQEYEQGYSSDTSAFLLQRIEYGCEGKTYENRSKNEERIDREDVMKMSKLTQTILDGTDYEYVQAKRRENFALARELFDGLNEIDLSKFYDKDTVPMVYPLLIKKEELLQALLDAKHFQGRWWRYLLSETPENSVEHTLSKYMIPITIDQRYGMDELRYVYQTVKENL